MSVLIPMAERFGLDLIHFGIMVIASLGIGYRGIYYVARNVRYLG